jgi:hypothetical protein
MPATSSDVAPNAARAVTVNIATRSMVNDAAL